MSGATISDHEGMTMMVVTHEMGFAKTVVDRVVEAAPPAEFFGKAIS